MEADAEFTKRLPKVELHAHLTGSITRECLHTIWLERKNEEPDFSLADPLESLPSGEADYDINTFFPLFNSYIYNLIITIPSVIHSTNAVLNDFFADGICYLELRTTPRASSGFTREQYITTILACIANRNRRQTAMRTYLILSVDRKHNAQEVAEIVDLAIKLQDKGVVGLDLCGNPAHPIDVNMLHREFSRAKKVGLGLTLHFAEIEASASRAELLGLLAMQPDRLGHVIHADKDIKGEIAKRKIGLELCLSCNVHAKLTTGGFQEHHFGEWYRRKDRGAVVLCTDDVGVFLSPLSSEYLLAMKHFGMAKKDLLDLCMVASGCIFADEDEAVKIRERVEAFREDIGLGNGTRAKQLGK